MPWMLEAQQQQLREMQRNLGEVLGKMFAAALSDVGTIVVAPPDHAAAGTTIRRGPPGASDEKKQEAIEGWPKAQAQGVTQADYAKSQGITDRQLRRWRKESGHNSRT